MISLNSSSIRKKIDRVPLPIWLLGFLIITAISLPIVYLIVRALGAGVETWDIIFRYRTLTTFGRTMALVIAAPLFSLAIALPLAFLTTRTDLPFRNAWSILGTLPLVIPSYIYAYVLISAFSPRGILHEFLASPLGIESLPRIYGFPGALLSVTAVSYPYLLLPLQSSLKGMDRSVEEASRSLGHGHFTTFRKVTLPLLRPAIASGGLLIGLYSLRDFGAVSLMRYETFTWTIYNQYFTPFGGRMIAAALSLILLIFALFILYLESRTRDKTRYYSSAESKCEPDLIELGRWRWPALIFCASIVTVFLILPMVVLGFWGLRGMLDGVSLKMFWDPAFNSLQASFLTALVVVLAAVPIGIITARFSGKMSQIMEKSAYLGFALPGIVIALALVFFSVGTPLYQTIFILIFGYMILFLPLALGSIRTSILQINPAVEEASRSLGKSPGETLKEVTLPLSKNGILAGAALVFLVTMKELQATLILSPRNFETLATSIWHATSEAFFARAAIPALLLIFLSSVPMMILLIFWHRRGDHERISGSL